MTYDKFKLYFLCCLCLFSLLLNIFNCKRGKETEKNDGIIERVDTIYKTDTVIVEKPQLIYKYISKIDTVELKVAGDTIYKQVEIPIESVHYSDSTYDLWISGFNARCDSLTIFPRETIIEKKITAYKRKKWGFTVGVGTQYDIINKTPTLGFGLMWGYRF